MIDLKLEVQLKLTHRQLLELKYISSLIDTLNDAYDKGVNVDIDELWNDYVFMLDNTWMKECLAESNKILDQLKINNTEK